MCLSFHFNFYKFYFNKVPIPFLISMRILYNTYNSALIFHLSNFLDENDRNSENREQFRLIERKWGQFTPGHNQLRTHN